MAPIYRIVSAPAHALKIVLDHLGLREFPYPEFPDYDDVIDIPGEGGPGGGVGGPGPGRTGPPRSGIFIVIMVFGLVAVMFTIGAGWIWCVAAHEPYYYSVRVGRRGPWRTERVIPFREWYRRRRNLPRTKSDLLREEHHREVIANLCAKNWRGRVNSNGEPNEHSSNHWKRPTDTKFWREHGHLGSNAQFNPRVPLLISDNRRGYNTFSKEGGHILGLSIPRKTDIEEDGAGLFTSVPYSPLTVPMPPLRRPPLKGVKGRTASTPSILSLIEDQDARSYREQRSNSWSGCSGGGDPCGRPWKCGRRGSCDSSDSSGGRSSWGSTGRSSSRGSSRSSRSSIGMSIRGLDVVEEEVLSSTEK